MRSDGLYPRNEDNNNRHCRRHWRVSSNCIIDPFVTSPPPTLPPPPPPLPSHPPIHSPTLHSSPLSSPLVLSSTTSLCEALTNARHPVISSYFNTWRRGSLCVSHIRPPLLPSINRPFVRSSVGCPYVVHVLSVSLSVRLSFRLSVCLFCAESLS